MNILKKIFLKIKYTWRDSMSKALIKFSLLVNSPALTARFASWLVREANKDGQYKILCMRRTIFMDDVFALIKISGRLHYLITERGIFLMILKHFSPKDEFKKLTENNYYSGKLCQDGMKKCYEYLKKMLPIFQKLVGFKTIFSGNFVYTDQQEVIRACTDVGIPYIILHKESLGLSAFESAAKLNKGKRFFGTRMMVYNEAAVDALSKAMGSDGISENVFKIVGCPRFDHMFKKDINVEVKNQILFFSFFPDAVFSYVVKDKKTLDGIYKRSEDFHLWIMRFAARHPEIKVIIKTKTAPYYFNYPKEIFNKNFNEKTNNLIITSRGNPSDMIKESRIVCAFKSLTMIEAVIYGKSIVSPYFADFVRHEPVDYFHEFPDMVNYPKSEEELEDFLLNPENYKKYNAESREKFLRHFIYIPDGRASIRAEDEIITVVNQYENSQE